MQTSQAQIHSFPAETNGKRSGQFPAQKSLPTWRERIKGFVQSISPRNWEAVTVNNKIDSVTMPKWVAMSILGAVLTFGMAAWYRSSSEHDTLIEIRTELRLSKEAQAEKDRINNGKLGDIEAWQGVVNGKLSEIKGMLSQQQIDALNKPQTRGQ